MSKYRPKKRDKHGVLADSVYGKVNGVMSKSWQDADKICAKAAKKHKLTRAQVFARLHRGRRRGLYEYERIIRFRLKSNKKK